MKDKALEMTEKVVNWVEEKIAQLGIEPAGLIRSKEKLFKEPGLSLADGRSREKWLKF